MKKNPKTLNLQKGQNGGSIKMYFDQKPRQQNIKKN